MKYLKNVLLAAGLVATTMGISLSANAGIINQALVTQDIYVDVIFADFNPFSIIEGDNQLIGSITYDAYLVDDFGFLDSGSTVLDLSIGTLSLGLADGFAAQDGLEIVAGSYNPLAGLDFLVESFGLFGAAPEFILDLMLDSMGGILVLDEIFYDEFGDIEDVFPVAFGETRLGEAGVEFVSEPSAFIIMLAGIGFLVRRKIATK